MKAGEPTWQTLERPRALTHDERRLLTSLAAAVDEPSLHRQVDTSTVAAVCRCGCSSVRLHIDEPALLEARVKQLSITDRADYFCIEAVGHGSEPGTVQVVLHVAAGRLHELEVFAGEGIAVSLAGVFELTGIRGA